MFGLACYRELGVDRASYSAVVGLEPRDSDDMVPMAAAFAGRGAGSCAVVPGDSVPSNHSLFGRNAGFPSDTQLVSPALQVSTTEPFIFKISHGPVRVGYR